MMEWNSGFNNSCENMKVGNNDPCPCGSGKKFKKCHRGAVATFKSERFVISVKVNGKIYKAFAIRFYENENKNVSGIQVDFPYKKKSRGLLSLATMPANVVRKDKLSLLPGGKVTSHNVKYSHWSDGQVHFSGSGKIFRTHSKTSFPLSTSIGHLFTVQLKGFRGFQRKIDEKKTSVRQFDLDVDMGGFTNESVKITAWWYEVTKLRVYGNQVPSRYSFVSDRGEQYTCFALEAPAGHRLSGKVLLLCFRREPHMTNEKGSHILFMGGFDTADIWKNLSRDYHFLTLLYPVRNYAKTLATIGSCDFPETLNG